MHNHVFRRPTLIEWCLSVAALTLVISVMAAMDTPVRHYAAAVASESATGSVRVHVPEPITRTARTAWRICQDHQPLAAFAGVASVLVLFMRRMR